MTTTRSVRDATTRETPTGGAGVEGPTVVTVERGPTATAAPEEHRAPVAAGVSRDRRVTRRVGLVGDPTVDRLFGVRVDRIDHRAQRAPTDLMVLRAIEPGARGRRGAVRRARIEATGRRGPGRNDPTVADRARADQGRADPLRAGLLRTGRARDVPDRDDRCRDGHRRIDRIRVVRRVATGQAVAMFPFGVTTAAARPVAARIVAARRGKARSAPIVPPAIGPSVREPAVRRKVDPRTDDPRMVDPRMVDPRTDARRGVGPTAGARIRDALVVTIVDRAPGVMPVTVVVSGRIVTRWALGRSGLASSSLTCPTRSSRGSSTRSLVPS
jgi:hypothetical protein